MKRLSVVLSLYLLTSSVFCSVLVKGRLNIPKASLFSELISPETRVCLENDDVKTCIWPTSDGQFTFSDVKGGADFVLRAISREYWFDSARVRVDEGVITCYEYIPGTDWNYLGLELPYPVVLEAREKYNYYVPRQGFNPISLILSPYMLAMGFFLVMIVFMPKLMKNMADPEMMEQLQNASTAQDSTGDLGDQPELPAWALKFAQSMGVQLPSELDGSKRSKKSALKQK